MTEQVVQETLLQPTTLLIVEDDPDIQQMLNDLLLPNGYHVLLAQSGETALALLEHEIVDLVLLDLMLPDMDGSEVCQQIRQNYGTSIPVMMLTAKKQPQQVVAGLRLGADDYLPKPFEPDELLLRIQRLVRQRQDLLSIASENGALREMLELVQQDLLNAQVETSTEALLRRELLHNVTTHLQSLVGIVEAEMRKLAPSPEREAMLRVRSRVRGAALIYQISQDLQTDPVAIGNVIRTVAMALKAIYRPWKRIVVDVVENAVDLPSAVAAPIAMIANELVTNCFKHAFPENRFGTIKIVYGKADSQFFLEVGDDGVGIANNATPGTGRTTVTQLAQGLNGSIEWASSSAGTCVCVRVPLSMPTQHIVAA
jgi:DNA-binding response OmpR family regulator/anti-sigma regulatory factor (Ser/Thr protein kinase)